MKNTTNIPDGLPFEEHEFPSVPFKSVIIRMEDLKLHVEEVIHFMRDNDVMLVIREADGTGTLFCHVSVYEWLKEHENLDEIQNSLDAAERST